MSVLLFQVSSYNKNWVKKSKQYNPPGAHVCDYISTRDIVIILSRFFCRVIYMKICIKDWPSSSSSSSKKKNPKLKLFFCSTLKSGCLLGNKIYREHSTQMTKFRMLEPLFMHTRKYWTDTNKCTEILNWHFPSLSTFRQVYIIHYVSHRSETHKQ